MDRETGPPPSGLETHRRYLELLARAWLDPRLRGKLDPSDLRFRVFRPAPRFVAAGSRLT